MKRIVSSRPTSLELFVSCSGVVGRSLRPSFAMPAFNCRSTSSKFGWFAFAHRFMPSLFAPLRVPDCVSHCVPHRVPRCIMITHASCFVSNEDAVSTKEDSGPPEEPLTTTHTDDRITTTPTIHSGPSPATPASSPSAIPASLISSPDTSTVASSDGASNAVTRLTGSTKLTRLMSICVDVAIRVGSESTSRRVGLDEREYFHGKGEGGWDYPATDEAGGNEEAELTRMALTLIYEILAGGR